LALAENTRLPPLDAEGVTEVQSDGPPDAVARSDEVALVDGEGERDD
jgi:hypothetical protein